MTGLTACGGDDGVKISDAAFVTKCKKELDKNARLKAYASDICTCLQDELVKGGNGDKTDQDQGLKDETVTATTKCTKEAAGIQ